MAWFATETYPDLLTEYRKAGGSGVGYAGRRWHGRPTISRLA
jgi:hypothetical protein